MTAGTIVRAKALGIFDVLPKHGASHSAAVCGRTGTIHGRNIARAPLMQIRVNHIEAFTLGIGAKDALIRRWRCSIRRWGTQETLIAAGAARADPTIGTYSQAIWGSANTMARPFAVVLMIVDVAEKQLRGEDDH